MLIQDNLPFSMGNLLYYSRDRCKCSPISAGEQEGMYLFSTTRRNVLQGGHEPCQLELCIAGAAAR